MKKKLSLLLLVFVASFTYGQTVSVGTGTAVNGSTEASPINIWYRKTVSHFVITKAEILAAGFTGPGTIHKLGWYVTQVPQYDLPDYRIQMKHTTATNAAGITNGGYTEVKSPANYAPQAGGWDLLLLDTPFDWNGVQNIAIRLCWTQVQPTYSSSGQCRVTPATNGFEYRWSDNGGNSCGQNPNSMASYKPQVQFVFDTLTTWTGIVSADWANPLNWSAGVPDERMDAVIPAGTPFNPTLSGSGECEEFILSGAFTMGAGADLNVHNNLTNTGTWIDNGGTLVMTGTMNNVISTAAITLSSLRIENDGTTSITGGVITLTDELQVEKSALNTNDLLLLRSDANGTARIAELKAKCTYTLNMQDSYGDGWNGGLITVFENGVEIGSFSAQGSSTTKTFNISDGNSFSLSYSSGNWDNENTYTLSDPGMTTLFSDGPVPSTGTVYTGTATCGFAPPISGAITMERYIDAGATYWRYFGSAVQGATIGQFNDDFTTAGYPGSLYPGFGWISAYNYNETMAPGLGYLACTSASQVMMPGEGWQIYCGDTITGTQPFVFDLVGVPNQGDINLPVTYTNTGTPSEDGYNMVCNPYASTVDWEDPDWVKTNVAQAIYIQNPDTKQYATYIAGASTNGGSRYIASQQSFWVQSFASSPVLTATEGVKSDVDQAFIKAANQYSQGMLITLQGNQNFDEVVLRHIPGASDDFEYLFDANKYWGGWGEYPQLSLINGQQKDLTVQSIDKGNQEWHIPLRAVIFQNGVYNMEFEHVGELDAPCIHLEDTYTGITYLVEEGASFSFNMSDTTYAARFILHIGRNYDGQTTSASCHNATDGSIELDLDIDQNVDYDLVVDGNTISGNDFGNPLLIDGLASGIYQIEIPGLVNYCNQTTFSFVVDQPAPINSSATVVNETQGADGSISLQVSGGTAPYQINWSNGGVGNQIDQLYPGLYSFQLTDVNGCDFDGEYTVNSVLSVGGQNQSEVTIFYSALQNAVLVENWFPESAVEQLTLYGMDGRQIKVYQVGSSSGNYLFELPELAEGVYLFVGKDFTLKFKK